MALGQLALLQLGGSSIDPWTVTGEFSARRLATDRCCNLWAYCLGNLSDVTSCGNSRVGSLHHGENIYAHHDGDDGTITSIIYI
jgi:hypothetical protein